MLDTETRAKGATLTMEIATAAELVMLGALMLDAVGSSAGLADIGGNGWANLLAQQRTFS